MGRKKPFFQSILAALFVLVFSQAANAGADWQEKQKQMFAQISVKPGDVIDRSNWQQAEGLLPEHVLNSVKAGDWILEIGEFEYDHDFGPEYYESAAKNAGKYTLGEKKEIIDIATGTFPKFIYGIPFPDVDVKNDPDGPIKFMHNNNLNIYAIVTQAGRTYPDKGNLQWVGRERGYERGVGFLSERFYWWNRPGGEVTNPRDYIFTSVAFVTFPYDLYGTITLYVRHLDGRDDTVFAYVPAIRRVKRLSGANRSDPQMGSDMTIDDSSGFNGHLESMKWSYIGEKIVLKPMWKDDAKAPRQLKKNKIGAYEYISYDSCDLGFEKEGWTGAPWAYTNLAWIPREMYVFKMEPLDPYYAYGVHHVYVDKLTTMVCFSMKYTRAGEFWKTVIVAVGPVVWPNGEKWFSMDGPMSVQDVKTDHASVLDIDDNLMEFDTPRVNPRTHTPQNLRTMFK